MRNIGDAIKVACETNPVLEKKIKLSFSCYFNSFHKFLASKLIHCLPLARVKKKFMTRYERSSTRYALVKRGTVERMVWWEPGRSGFKCEFYHLLCVFGHINPLLSTASPVYW